MEVAVKVAVEVSSRVLIADDGRRSRERWIIVACVD